MKFITPAKKVFAPIHARKSTIFGSRHQMQNLSPGEYGVCRNFHQYLNDCKRIVNRKEPISYCKIIPLSHDTYEYAFRQYLLTRDIFNKSRVFPQLNINEKIEDAKVNSFSLFFEKDGYEVCLLFIERDDNILIENSN